MAVLMCSQIVIGSRPGGTAPAIGFLSRNKEVKLYESPQSKMERGQI